MSGSSSNLAAQRRLLQSLGFGFVETPLDVNALDSADPRERKTAAPERKPAPAARRHEPLPRQETSPVAPYAPPAAPPEGLAERQSALDALHTTIAACVRCNLSHIRKNVVPGIGPAGARLMMVAEVPFAEDDATGSALNGPLGEMTRRMIGAMKLAPEQVYFTTCVKCRTMDGRNPSVIERKACQPHLLRQIQLVQPEVVVAFGGEALAALVPARAAEGIAKVRGHWLSAQGTPVMPTWSLTAIADDAALKRAVWQDMQVVMKKLAV